MNRALRILLYFFIVLFVISCRHEVQDYGQNRYQSSINPAIHATPEFDWQMSHDVLFYIKNCKGKIIKITSPSGEILYHKGQSNKENYDISINLHTYMEQIKINDHLIEITGNAVIFEFQSNKGFKESGNALCFDGIEDYADADNELSSYPYTLSAWFKAEENPDPGTNMVIAGMVADNKNNRFMGIYLEYLEAPVIPEGTITLMARKGSTSRLLYSNTVAIPGIWYHVAAVVASKDYREFYINGQLVGTDTRRVSLATMNTIGVARWSDKTPGSYFHGSVDEVRLWDYARTGDEILADMNATLTGNEDGLEGYWPFDEGSGSSSADLTNNGNNMELFENTEWCSVIADADGDGIPDDEDDYPYDPERAFNNYWPADTGTLAFEDLWPSIADYDFNDLVMGYMFNCVTNAGNQLVETFGTFQVKATGAGFENGFGFSLPGLQISQDDVIVAGYSANNGITTFNPNGSEAGQTHFTVIVYDIVPWVGNTRPNQAYNPPVTIEVKIGITGGGPYEIGDVGLESFNPFLIVNKERSHEIHLADYPPTDLMDYNLFNKSDDASNPPLIYFKSYDNLPWALNFPQNFNYTYERDTLWQGHLKFIEWVNSGGTIHNDWFTDQPGYRNNDKIYSPPQ